MNRQYQGFTLLEILVAIAIAALLMIATWTWFIALVRNGQALDLHHGLVEEAITVARIMAEDADLADWHGVVIPVEMKEPRLCFPTLCQPTSQARRGWQNVVWQWSQTSGLTRTSGDEPPRLVSRRLRCRWYFTVQPSPHLWVALRPDDQSANAAASGNEWIFPLEVR